MADVVRRLAPYFARSPSRHRAQAYLQGLLSEAERKNSWQVAEVSGEATPYGFQYLLSRADWDADAVRDELRLYVIHQLGDPNGVLVLDETGLLKKGAHSAGVARQYSGTAGTVEHCQIGVFLSSASPLGHALLDRKRYLPTAWTDAGARCRQAGISADRPCATKPQLAQQRLNRAFRAGGPATWVTGDRLYGADRRVRLGLEAQPQADVLAVSGQAYVWSEGRQRQGKTIWAALPEAGWGRLSAGDGAKGPCWDDWRWLPLAAPLAPGWRRWLLVRRRLSTPTELTASGVFAPHATPRQEVVRVAGRRWTVESGFEEATGEVGLDQYEGRSWTAWYRHITLAMWALALLTVMRAGTIVVEAFKKHRPPPQVASPLAAFKARRGLASRCACPSCGGCGGESCWPCPTRPATSWPGRSGVSPIRASPSIPMIHVGRHSWGRWLLHHLVTTVVIRSVKDEALSRLILFGERSLRYALNEYVTHYHTERPHQGKGNVVLMPSPPYRAERQGPIRCHERLGGLLKYYAQEAA